MALENPNIQRRKKNSSLSPDITDRAPARFDVGTLEEALNKIVKAGCCIIFAIAVIVIGKEDVIFDISGIYIYICDDICDICDISPPANILHSDLFCVATVLHGIHVSCAPVP